MEEKKALEELKQEWRNLNLELRNRNRLDLTAFKRLFSETYSVLSKKSAADSIPKNCVELIAEAYLFANTNIRELGSSCLAAFVLTERMLNSCIFSGIQSECGISAVYVIEAREEVYINFNDVDEAMRKLEAVLEACFRNTF